MKTTRKSIFELERRCNLPDEFEIIRKDFAFTTIHSSLIKDKNISALLNSCIKTWPYREGATNIDSYVTSHGFDYNNQRDKEKLFYYFELYYNLLQYAPAYEKLQATSTNIVWLDDSNVKAECTRCLENIEFLLEKQNMRVRKVDVKPFPQYIVSKRDAQVDAVIEAVPELAEALLSYLDIRNRNDEEAKKAILKVIADHLEQKRKDKFYKGTVYFQLSEDLFTVFNNASIRHKTDQQWKLRKPERMKLYDQTFKAAIHLMQMEDVKDFNNTVSNLKKKQTELVEAKPKNTN